MLGGGGYVAGPVGLAALSLRIPLVLTEADSHLGLANRLLARGARRVCLAFPITGRDGDRYRVTGRPIPVPDAGRDEARALFGIARDETCVLVFGGSLGARSINLASIEAFAGGAEQAADARDAAGEDSGETTGGGLLGVGRRDGGRSVHVLHIAGRRDHPELASRTLPDGYDLREYLDLEEFAQALAAADLVVARAGGSVFEIAAYGLPAILIPYPQASADHQTANARWMVDAGAAVLIPDAELTGARLARELAVLLERSCAPDADGDGVAIVGAAGGRTRGGIRAARRGRGDRLGRRSHELLPERPWDGRRLHFVGVGGRRHERLRARGPRARRAGQRLRSAPPPPIPRAWPQTACCAP